MISFKWTKLVMESKHTPHQNMLIIKEKDQLFSTFRSP